MHQKLRFLLILLWIILPVTAAQVAFAKPAAAPMGTTQSRKKKSGTKVTPAKAPASNRSQTDKQPSSQEERMNAVKTAIQSILELYSTQKATALSYCEEAMDLLEPSDPEKIRISLMLMCMDLYAQNDRPKDVLALGASMSAWVKDRKSLQSLHFMEATALTKLQDWKAARMKYAECPNQDDFMVMSNVAELYMIEGDSKRAAEAYRKSLEFGPDNPHALFGLASALHRAGNPGEAKDIFLKGIEADSQFSYLKEAFFEPEGETDFQTGFRMYEGKRLKEARHYLQKHAALEARPDYKAHAHALLDSIEADLKAGKAALATSYPVVLSNVRAAAISADARFLAFAALERDKENEYTSVIWSLDTHAGKPFREAAFPGEIIFDLAFVEDSTLLRALSTQHHYALDAADGTHDYYVFENNGEQLPAALAPSGTDILAMTPNALLTISPWHNPYAEAPLMSVPSNISRLKVSADRQTAVLTTATKTELFDLNTQETVKTFPRSFYAYAIAAHPQKNLFALGMESGAVLVDESGKLTEFFATPGQVVTLAFAPSGRYLMTLSEHTAEIWRIQPEEQYEEQKP